MPFVELVFCTLLACLGMICCRPRNGRCAPATEGNDEAALEARPLGITNAAEVPRRLPLARGRNFRDLGGIATADGRQVRTGRLFRADDLNALCEADLDFLAAIPIATVIDFRAESETKRHPDKLPDSVRRHLLFPIVPGQLEPWNPDEGLRAKGGLGFMRDIYRSLVLDECNIAVYRKFFHYVREAECLPLLFHCSAGKDRTGMAAAFILFSLGVDQKSIMCDYLDSNTCLAGKYDNIIARRPERAPIFFADPEYLHAAIAAMEEQSGSVEQYLVDVLKVDMDAMRAVFLC